MTNLTTDRDVCWKYCKRSYLPIMSSNYKPSLPATMETCRLPFQISGSYHRVCTAPFAPAFWK